MSIYACEVCGYEYRPDVGDPEGNIEEGVEFEDLPAEWVCPQCGASKDDFDRINDSDEPDDEEI